MSYNSPGGLIGKSLELVEISLSGSPALNGYFTFNTQIESTFSDVISGLSSETLTLPAGFYWAQAVLSITRTAAADNYEFQFEVDSSLHGKEGQSGWLNNIRADFADAMFENTSSTISLKLKCTAIEGSAPTIVSDSRFYIWRVKS